MLKAMTFDVESVGLHGEGFAVGWVVRDEQGQEIDSGYLACPIVVARGESVEDRQWVTENICPHLPESNCANPREVRSRFWKQWLQWKEQGYTLWADCGWPVEANFLSACVQDDWGDRCWAGPYPLMEIATVLQMAGMDPLGKYERYPDECPIHHPTCDARQSGRILFEAMQFKSTQTQVELFMDGDQWCALLGENLQEGKAGFGDTKSEALRTLADRLETEGDRNG